jgi:hypothetical protein
VESSLGVVLQQFVGEHGIRSQVRRFVADCLLKQIAPRDFEFSIPTSGSKINGVPGNGGDHGLLLNALISPSRNEKNTSTE